jgi:hypothetical protein
VPDVLLSELTPATLGGERHAAARTVVSSLHACAPDIGATMARHLHATIAELHGTEEPAFFDETEASCTSNMEQLLGLLARGEPASAMTVPDAALRYAQGLVRRRIPLDVLLRAYRLGHAYLWDLTARRFREQIDHEDELLAALEASATFMFEYVDLISADLVAAYHVERDRWVRSAAAVRAETAREILGGEVPNESTASARLGYELRRHHVAAVVALDPHLAVSKAELSLEREALAVSSALGCGDALVIPAGAAVLWAWFGSTGRPGREQLTRLEAHRTPPGVRMAIGRPAEGVEGFRVSHVEAQHAARFWDATAASGVTVAYRKVELVSLLAADIERARRFVAGELGPLAARTEAAENTRRTLMAFLSGGGSHVHAAEVLHMHPNTVYKKVRRVEQLLEVSVAERRVELTNALMLAQTLGTEVLCDV